MRLFLQFIFAICGFDYRAVGGGGSSLLVVESSQSSPSSPKIAGIPHSWK